MAHLLTARLPIILVDDGSDSVCAKVLQKLASDDPGTEIIRLPTNRGKGGALKAGLREAKTQGFSHALQIDADGQHATEDVARFLAMGKNKPAALICGCPIYDSSVPAHRYYARYLTHIWVWINSLSLAVKDSMCGFRLYPLKETVALIDEQAMGNRMEFESEIAVHWVWCGGEVINLPTQVSYPVDGISHFSPWRDNLAISKMHATLFFGMLRRLPRLVARKLTKRKLRPLQTD